MILFKNIELQFNRGVILTQEMLRELQAFPKDNMNIQYAMYPDGILAGTDLTEKEAENEETEIWIKKGLIKYKDCIYRMAEDINLTQCIKRWTEEGKIEEQINYKLVFMPGSPICLKERCTQVLYPMQLVVFPKSEENEGIFFAQFKMADRGKINLFHTIDMKDISRAVYWNMIECPYSCRGGVTYHPYIFEAIKRLLMNKKERTSLDYMIINEISMTGIISFSFVEMILKDKQATVCTKDRISVLKQLVTVLMKEKEFVAKEDIVKAEEREEGRLLP